MKNVLLLFLCILVTACAVKPTSPSELVLAFGSCSNQNKENQLWNEVLNSNPSMFIWLGDAVYPGTYDLAHLEKAYQKQISHPAYQNLAKSTLVTGIYDDHDYGMNDGGKHNPFKQNAQKLFLKYIENSLDGLPEIEDQPLYFTTVFNDYRARLFVLDTRYERDDLTKSTEKGKRYEPNETGSILGSAQWQNFEKDLKNSTEKTIIIVSSIQLLNDSHGFEKWGNMPHERQRMLDLLANYPEKTFIILSGDRHFSEISELNGITEITSSGLTEVYTMANEPNPLRKGNLIKEQNFGILKFNASGGIKAQIIGDNNKVLLTYKIK